MLESTGTLHAPSEGMLTIEIPVAEIVLDHSECAAVLDRYRIDYCCRGRQSLREACGERSLDPGTILDECELAIRRREPKTTDPRTLTTRQLITDVIGRHHRYLHRALPFLQTLSHKVAQVHGGRQEALRELASQVEALSTTLIAHLDDEERTLFPALLTNDVAAAAPMLATMREEHEVVGKMLADIRTTSEDYACPEWACNSYRTLMAELANLEADTLRHVHVENHVLMPRFVATA